MSILLTLLFLGLSIGISIFAGYLSLRLIGKNIDWQYVSFGAGIFFVGITIHSLLALPIVVTAHGFKIFLDLHNKTELTFRVGEIFYFALAAGIGQEAAKGLPVWFELKRTNSKNPAHPYFWQGLNIGLGFSLSEILIIGITSWQPEMDNLTLSNVFVGSFERLSGTFFHIATGLLIVFGIEKSKTKYFLPLCILLHAIADFFAGYLSKYPLVSLPAEELVLFLFSITLLGTSLFFVRKG